MTYNCIISTVFDCNLTCFHNLINFHLNLIKALSIYAWGNFESRIVCPNGWISNREFPRSVAVVAHKLVKFHGLSEPWVYLQFSFTANAL